MSPKINDIVMYHKLLGKIVIEKIFFENGRPIAYKVSICQKKYDYNHNNDNIKRIVWASEIECVRND